MRLVKFLRTHATLHIPSTGELGNTLPSKSKTFPNLKMVEADAGVLVSFGPGKSDILIPWAAISVAEMGAELPPPEEKAKK